MTDSETLLRDYRQVLLATVNRCSEKAKHDMQGRIWYGFGQEGAGYYPCPDCRPARLVMQMETTNTILVANGDEPYREVEVDHD